MSNPRELISKAVIDALHDNGYSILHHTDNVADKIAYHAGMPIEDVRRVLDTIRDLWKWSW